MLIGLVRALSLPTESVVIIIIIIIIKIHSYMAHLQSSMHLKSFSFSVPVPANHVSCRMMVILAFSLLSSLFMTALFLVSLMS